MRGAMTDAYEQERARLSRELHDDIAQRIALLATELALLRRRLTGAPEDLQEHVAKVATEAASIGEDLHRIARGLHPAGLERLGLQESIQCLCAQLGNAHRMTIDVHVCDVPPALDRDAVLCLYRIGQEALHNVVKHSGASHAIVSLMTTRDEVVLRIVDRGAGFDTRAVHSKETLGLISMRERARLVNARLLVSSTPGGGTMVETRVPVAQALCSVSG